MLALVLSLLFLGIALEAADAANVVVIGDSLSAEYETIPDFPGTDNPTEYARVTVEGWESMSWVEVLGRLRPAQFNFGRYRSELPGWPDLRFTGYEFNFAIPGFRAAQYEDIVNSSFFSNPQYLPFRSTLADALRNQADWVVIWLGANEFRANYGALADGQSPAQLISNLTHDLGEVVDFVREQRSGATIVLANIPDLNAAPSKRDSQPDPAKRARVTAATQQANAAIATLAASKGVAVADVYSQTERLINGVTTYFGAVDIVNDTDPDNNPRFHFCRDGLHPNTPSQIEIARVIIGAFDIAYAAGIANISDAEALAFLGLRPDEPYWDWINGFAVSDKGMADDPDRDGLPNLVEMAFGSNPSVSGAWPVTVGIESQRLRLTYATNPKYQRLVRVKVEESVDLRTWTDLPASGLNTNADGSVAASISLDTPRRFLRVNVVLLH